MAHGTSHPHRLIVEGPDDRETLLQLCNAHDYNSRTQPSFEIQVADGVANVPRAFRSAVQGSYRAVAAIIDADGPDQQSGLEQRWRSWQDLLMKLGYQAPATLPAQGLVLKPQDRPAIGLWIMPDNQRDGAIEDWLLGLVPAADPLLPSARAAVARIGEEVDGSARYAEKDRRKAELHTWLACKPSAPTPAGRAFQRQYLSATHSDALALVTWLRVLFG